MNTETENIYRFILRRENNCRTYEHIILWDSCVVYLLFLLLIIDNIGQKLYHITECVIVIGFLWKYDNNFILPHFCTCSWNIDF